MLTLTNIVKIWVMFVKKFSNRTVYFSSGYPLSPHMGNKWFNCCGEWFRVATCSNNSQRFSTNGRINYTRWYITWLIWQSGNIKRKWISFIKETKMKLSILSLYIFVRMLWCMDLNTSSLSESIAISLALERKILQLFLFL